jgi:Ca2+-dependent lipid-binding protein
MDWKVSFTPTDVYDLTPREQESKVNPKIILTIRVGKGMLGAGMPVLVEDISFKGYMRIKVKLMSKFPHAKRVEICFMEKPEFDYVLKPVGGDTFGFDINNVRCSFHFILASSMSFAFSLTMIAKKQKKN